MVKLRVKNVESEDVYKDIIRVHKNFRRDVRGQPIKEGRIILLSVNDEKCRVCARGAKHQPSGPNIFMDEVVREKLDIEEGREYEFKLVQSCWAVRWGRSLRWAWDATDPCYLITVRIAVVLGSLSVVLGVMSIILSKCAS